MEAYRQEAPSGRERKYYHLTRKGQGALREEKQAWERYAGAVNDVLRGGAEAEPV